MYLSISKIGKCLELDSAKFPNPVLLSLNIFWGDQVHNPERGVCLFECVIVLTFQVSQWIENK